MADQKLTDKTELAASPATVDWVHAIDVDDLTGSPQGTSKKLSIQNLLSAIVSVLLPSSFNFNNFKGINLATPTNDLDAANKAYVDSLIDGLKWKECARVATTSNITLSGLQTIDTVALAEDDRVIVWQQSDLTENGVYLAKSGAWVRSDDANTSQELVCLAIDAGSEGATYDNVSFQQTTPSPITVGISNIVFVTRASTTDHNSLAGVQGGVVGERNHLSNAQIALIHAALTLSSDTKTQSLLALSGQELQVSGGWSKTVFSSYKVGTTADPSTTAETPATAPVLAEMTHTFTPAKATNLIKVKCGCSFDKTGGGDDGVRMAVFVDGVVQTETTRRDFVGGNDDYDTCLHTFW